MLYARDYDSKLGKITIVSDKECIVGLFFENQKHFLNSIHEELLYENNEILDKACIWLDAYFNGECPSIDLLSLKLNGTMFQKEVWDILMKIPYGKLITYKDIADEIAKNRGIDKMSAQAVGGAVGHNPISIIVPCHRVIGTNGSLTGYAGGIHLKKYLLIHEGIDISKYHDPK